MEASAPASTSSSNQVGTSSQPDQLPVESVPEKTKDADSSDFESTEEEVNPDDETASNLPSEAKSTTERSAMENVTTLREQLEDMPLVYLPFNRPITIRRVGAQHPVFVIDNFLSEEECQSIIRYGEPKLKRSTAVENDQLVIKDYRNSWTGFISPSGKFSPHSAVNEVLKRVCAFSGYPVDHMESVNIVRYRGGEKYEPHFDYFNPDNVKMIGKAGQRVMTFFVYLNDVPEECGGATYFDTLGLRVQPKMGSCAVWFNTDPTGKVLYHLSHHGGEEIKATEKYPNPVKYALNVWVRQNCFCCGKGL